MDKRRTGGEARTDHQSGAGRGSERDEARGAVHTFVEMGELRRIMGCLTAIEMLRLLFAADAPPYGA
ncbi:MAG TPA: hypothetical protein VH853_03315 [Polyangia bacterium]|jgi:hypothetical protein|nr:hypothetical protein [Polyangia bacterium]